MVAVWATMLQLHCTLYVHCTLYTILQLHLHCSLYTVRCTLFTECTLYAVHCTLCTLYTVHAVHCTQCFKCICPHTDLTGYHTVLHRTWGHWFLVGNRHFAFESGRLQDEIYIDKSQNVTFTQHLSSTGSTQDLNFIASNIVKVHPPSFIEVVSVET